MMVPAMSETHFVSSRRVIIHRFTFEGLYIQLNINYMFGNSPRLQVKKKDFVAVRRRNKGPAGSGSLTR